MMQNYRIGETADMLGVSRETVRNYLKRAPNHFTDTAIKQRSKRFTPRDIATLEEIQRLIGEGVPSDQVADQLPLITEILDNGQEPKENNTALQPIEFFEHFQKEHAQTIAAKDEVIAILRAENAYLKMPFWKKWFYSPD